MRGDAVDAWPPTTSTNEGPRSNDDGGYFIPTHMQQHTTESPSFSLSDRKAAGASHSQTTSLFSLGFWPV